LYRCTIESILSDYITAWYGYCPPPHIRRALQRVVQSAQRIIGGKLPALQDTYSIQCHRKAEKSRTTTTRATACSPRYHPVGEVSTGAAGTERLKNSFYLKAIRQLNNHH
jgi:gmma-aminobutyric acid receptor subunit gamma